MSRVPSPSSPCHLYWYLQKNGHIEPFMFDLVCLVWSGAIYHSCCVKKLEPVPMILVKLATFLGMCLGCVLEKDGFFFFFSEIILRSVLSILEYLKHPPLPRRGQTLFNSYSSLVIWWLHSCDYQDSFKRPWISTWMSNFLCKDNSPFQATWRQIYLCYFAEFGVGFVLPFFAFSKNTIVQVRKNPLVNLVYSSIIQLLWLWASAYAKTENT